MITDFRVHIRVVLVSEIHQSPAASQRKGIAAIKVTVSDPLTGPPLGFRNL